MEEKVLWDAVATFLMRGNEVLLAWKAMKINKNRWCPYGGGIEEGELPREAAVREAEEESGGVRVDPESLAKIAIVDFHNTMTDGGTFTCRVHAYTATRWEGTPASTDEMLFPLWFRKSDLPFGAMPPGDRDWVPLALGGKRLIGRVYLGPFQKTKLGETEISFVDAFSEEERLERKR